MRAGRDGCCAPEVADKCSRPVQQNRNLAANSEKRIVSAESVHNPRLFLEFPSVQGKYEWKHTRVNVNRLEKFTEIQRTNRYGSE